MNTPATRQMSKTRGAVIYTRVSTGEQDKHGTSPETQRDACRAKALAMGLPIIAEYYDPGISGGFLLARKDFQAAIADIQAGRADTLICPNISRYSRDEEHQQAVKKAIRAAGGRLAFCDMEFEDTPQGDLNFAIHGSFAAYERKVIRDRCMKGKRKRAEEGQQVCPSRPPAGYHIVLKADILRGAFPAEMLGRYVVDEARAPVIRELFARYAAGECGTPKLAQDFNARGIPPLRGGRLWRCSTLRAILTNPVYKGEAAYGRRAYHMDESRLHEVNKLTGLPLREMSIGVPAPEGYTVALSAPPLVSEEVWDAAQKRLTTNRGNMGGNPRRARMLSGRIFCPCGHKATCRGNGTLASGRKLPDNYQCSQARNAQMWTAQAVPVCSLELFRVSETEAAVVRAFLSAARQPAALEDARRAYAERQAGKTLPSAAGARREMAELEQALTALKAEEAASIQAQISGIRAGASPDAYAEVFASIAARRKDMEDRRGQMARLLAGDGGRQKPPAPTPGKMGSQALETKALEVKALEDAAHVLGSPDVPGETKREIIGMVIERVVCQKEGADVYFLPGFGQSGTGLETRGTDSRGMETLQSVQTLRWLDA